MMNFYAYLHALRNKPDPDIAQDSWFFQESNVRREAKGSEKGGRFAEKPETKAKKDKADLLDKEETGGPSFMEAFNGKQSNDKVYAVSDIHSTGIEGITDKDSGTIVIAGDFMEKGKKKEDIPDAEKWWKERFLPWCDEHKDQQIVIIGGNCDKWLYYNRDKVEWPKNVHYLDDSAADVNGMKVYGTSWCPHNMNGAWEVSEEEMEEEFSKIPEGLDILVTHTPPKGDGIELDHDAQFDNHFGSKALTKAILEKKPKIVLCGHVHSGSHKPMKIGDSIVMNVSRVDDDRYERSFHGRRIGVERTDNGLGFLVDMDYDGRISLGKKEDIPEGLIKLRDSLRRAAKAIQSNIDKGGDGPDKELIKKANEAIDASKEDLEGFDHPKKKMLEESIKAFKKSEENGFSVPMPRVGKLYDGDKNGKHEWLGSYGGHGSFSGHGKFKLGGNGHGYWSGGSHSGGHGGAYVPPVPPWWMHPASGSSASKSYYGGHGGGYFGGGHYTEAAHKQEEPPQSHGKHSGMSIADILSGKGKTSNYIEKMSGKQDSDDDNPFDEFGLPK